MYDIDDTEGRYAPHGCSFAELRQQMVDDQIKARGIRDPRVLAAMSRIPREEFVPKGLWRGAYEDCPLPIGFGQTISQPFTVAFMCEAASLNGDETVLEIGTGSGYGAAVLSELARRVYSVERIEPLAAEARLRLERLGYTNVTVAYANGTLGCPDGAPYDAIVVTAGAEKLPLAYVHQLADSGRLVIPLGSRGMGQTMYRFTKHGDHLETEDLGAFTFVPLISGQRASRTN